jgi:sugar lactone lactonase YvrE
MEFTPVATGFCLIEAPRADARGIWFSDILLGGIRCLRPDGRIDAWLTDRRFIGGIAFNHDGLVLCAGTDGLVWLDPDSGATGVLLNKVEGRRETGINDVLPDGRGGLYFGTVDHQAMLRGEDFYGRSAFCRLDADGRVTVIHEGLAFANGIGLSPDGHRLYFNDSATGTYVSDVSPDGNCTKGSLLIASADCDGLAVDADGGIWIAGVISGNITRFFSDGKVDRAYPVPGGHVISVSFGGAGLRDMYITTAAPGAGEAAIKGAVPEARTAVVYRVRADIPGVPVAQSRFQVRRK